jgi:phosphohistidine phosphatase
VTAEESARVELCLLRHAHAGDPLAWSGADAERPLSARGRKQADRLGRLLGELGFAPSLILSSPKVRALETAQIVGGHLGANVRLDDRLAGGADLVDLEELLSAAGDPPRPLLVGHDPDFSGIASTLVGAAIAMPKGALVRIDAARPLAPGMGILRWLVPPDLLRPER